MDLTPSAELARQADWAVVTVRSAYRKELDFSEQSVGIVEAILNEMWAEGNNPVELLGQTAVLFGAYIGEMIRKQCPQAYWTDGSLTPEEPPPSLVVGEISISPIAWCFKRLSNGPSDSVVEKYMAFRRAAIERGEIE
jgi:hypothetical protein